MGQGCGVEEMRSRNESGLLFIERLFLRAFSPMVPGWMGTKLLTLLSFLSSIFMLISYIFSQSERLFLLLASFFLVMQWILDCLDGHIGRIRKEGFMRWGYFMDHLFDYGAFAFVFLGYYLLLPGQGLWLAVFFLIVLSFMVMAILFDDSEGDSKRGLCTSFFCVSPIELRLGVVVLNTLLFFFFDWARLALERALPYASLAGGIFLVAAAYVKQKRLSEIDDCRRNP
jgi:phosphatidylglycerophosphate synthase